ncbi:hypothetical protein KSS87_017064 [Heliosperma pusillum]|nr:hypothetical protein KSS87_017064 [Heliosperma pusillum]
MAKPGRGRGPSPSNSISASGSSSRSRSRSRSYSRSSRSRSRSRSRSFSSSSSSPSRSVSSRSRSRSPAGSRSPLPPPPPPPPSRKSPAEVPRRAHSPLVPAKKVSPPRYVFGCQMYVDCVVGVGIHTSAQSNAYVLVGRGGEDDGAQRWRLDCCRRKSSTISESKVLHVDKLTRNVNEGHLKEIFSNYGEVANVELVMDRTVNLPKGYGYVEFKTRADAEEALLYMNEAQIDGNVIKVTFTLPPREKVSPVKAVVPPKRDVTKNDGSDAGKDGPKRTREPSPRPRRSPVARRGASPRRVDPPPRRRADSPNRRRDSPPRRGDSPSRRRLASPRGRSPPVRRLRSPLRGSPRRRGSPIRRRSPVPSRRRFCGLFSLNAANIVNCIAGVDFEDLDISDDMTIQDFKLMWHVILDLSEDSSSQCQEKEILLKPSRVALGTKVVDDMVGIESHLGVGEGFGACRSFYCFLCVLFLGAMSMATGICLGFLSPPPRRGLPRSPAGRRRSRSPIRRAPRSRSRSMSPRRWPISKVSFGFMGDMGRELQVKWLGDLWWLRDWETEQLRVDFIVECCGGNNEYGDVVSYLVVNVCCGVETSPQLDTVYASTGSGSWVISSVLRRDRQCRRPPVRRGRSSSTSASPSPRRFDVLFFKTTDEFGYVAGPLKGGAGAVAEARAAVHPLENLELLRGTSGQPDYWNHLM